MMQQHQFLPCRMSRTLSLLVAMAAVSLGSVVAPTPGTVSAANEYIFWFQKNYNDRLNSTLWWTNQEFTQGGSWRAGSGRNMDECHTSAMPPVNNGGWLPNGNWTISGAYVNYNGNVIKGPAIAFNPHLCSNGYTWRTEIFIHSKIPWPQPNGEYMSQACVKVSSTGATPATAGGDVRSVYDVRNFLAINYMIVG